MKFVKIFSYLIIFILSAFPLWAQTGPDITGRWEGAIKLPGMELGIVIDFSKDSVGTWKGLIDIPMQGAVDLPLSNIKTENSQIYFEILNIPGSPSFNGAISDNTKSISGDFSQAGATYPLALALKELGQIEQETKSLDEKLISLRLYIDSTLKIWKIPGLAIAIVKDKDIIFSEGFGLRSVKDTIPVTSKTIFAIGSSTKAFTTMAMGMLVDDGKLEWDKPVREYIHDFKMKDDFASERMTPRDLVTHRSGLPRHDLVWYNNQNISRKDLVKRLQFLEPNKDFRTEFQYQNLMFLIAGYLVEYITGKTWEDNVKARIFEPLGMNSSNFSVLESMKSVNFALPYKELDSVVKEIPFRNITVMGPAGSINSNLEDMCQWMLLHLNNGKAYDSQLISAAGLSQMHTPYMAISRPLRYPESSHLAYGLGWFIEMYRGHNRVHHGGNIDGFSALVSLYPNDNMGIVVLTNMDGSPVPGIVSSRAADLLLDLTPVDWSTRMKLEEERAESAKLKETGKEPDRILGTKPSHKLADYSGEYENLGYGNSIIESDGKELIVKYNDFTGKLIHWHYDVFRADIKDFEDQKILFTFSANAKGDIDKISSPLEPLVSEIVFMKKPSGEMRDTKFLAKLAGDYEIGGEIAKFAIKGESILTLSLPGQPLYELEPYKGTEFNIKGLSGFSVEFELDKNGKVSTVLFKQPNGIFTAKKIK
jgi:CubicO group peptidase (beta-lactamase class C family)